MKFIYKKDDDGSWHKMHDIMPPMTSDVEVKTIDGSIIPASIVVDMAGYYIYFDNNDGTGWGCLDDYTHWRYKK